MLLLLGAFEELVVDDRIGGTRRVIRPAWEKSHMLADGTTREQVVVSRDDEVSTRWLLFRRKLPDLEVLAGARLGEEPGERRQAREAAVGRRAIVEVGDQLRELIRIVLRIGNAAVTLKRVGGDRVGVGAAADADVDSTPEHAAQHAEGLGHLAGAVVVQHHAAAAYADPGCVAAIGPITASGAAPASIGVP